MVISPCQLWSLQYTITSFSVVWYTLWPTTAWFTVKLLIFDLLKCFSKLKTCSEWHMVKICYFTSPVRLLKLISFHLIGSSLSLANITLRHKISSLQLMSSDVENKTFCLIGEKLNYCSCNWYKVDDCSSQVVFVFLTLSVREWIYYPLYVLF